MRIAQVATLWESVPPLTYGGTERVVSYLAEALVRLGHGVTLYAAGDSVTSAELRACCRRSLRQDPAAGEPLALHERMMRRVLADAAEFDVIHFHTGSYEFARFDGHPTPCLTTLHGRLDIPDIQGWLDRFPDFPVVSISDAQRLPIPAANWLATVPHGLPAKPAEPGPWGRGYLAFLGRIAPEKRPDLAIEIARRAGLPLKIAAKVDRVDQAYFETVIRPLLDPPGIEFVGELGEADKMAFLAGALALLFPIDWPEPFGLVMIEAMACGAPVIAFRRGSVPEVIEDGVTGYIVEDAAEAVAALGRLDRLDRRRIGEVFRRRFWVARMARDYLRLYERLLDRRPSVPRDARRRGAAGRGAPDLLIEARGAD